MRLLQMGRRAALAQAGGMTGIADKVSAFLQHASSQG